jgi:hypothetical protein
MRLFNDALKERAAGFGCCDRFPNCGGSCVHQASIEGRGLYCRLEGMLLSSLQNTSGASAILEVPCHVVAPPQSDSQTQGEWRGGEE